jgi:membrane fusion protein, protease secretion system
MFKNMFATIKSWFSVKLEKLQETQSDKEGHEVKDETHYARMGWIVLAVGFGGFMLWAMFAPLDKGVSAQGTVITDGQRKLIQPAVSGVIEEILVKDGDKVTAGQLLVRLNDLQVHAQAEGTREAIAGIQGQIAGLEASVSSQQAQLTFLKEQLASMRQLAKEGYVARNRVLELERTYAQISGSLAENQGNLERYRRQLNELQKKLPAHEFDLENATIESPVDGSVVNLQVFTKGQVVQAGAKLMEISPVDQDLVVEAKVPVVLIDKVHVGLPVEMIFSAFNQRTTPRIPGEVSVVSADRTTDERTGETYYKIQARVSDKGQKLLHENQIRPGMPVEVFVITGERTMMNYLLRPLLDRARTSLGEE